MNNPTQFDDIRQTLAPGEGVSMRPRELETSHALLARHVALNPAIAPWYVRMMDRAELLLAGAPVAHMQHAFAVLMVVVFVGTGTSYAAENALPGDLLYPVKKVVNERVRSAIALSPTAQVEWQTERVNRRLTEVSALAEKSELTPALTIDAERDMSDAADEIDAHATAVIASNDSIESPKIAEAQVRLREVLKGRVKSLEAQAATDQSTSTREGLASVSAHVRGRFHTDDDELVAVASAMSDTRGDSSTARSRESKQRSGKRPAATTAIRSNDSGDDDGGIRATATLMSIGTTTPTSTPALSVPSVSRHGDDEDEFEDD